MKETTLYGILDRLDKKVNIVDQRASLGVTSEAIRNQAMYKLLVKKGLLTEQEFTEEVGQIIKEMNQPKQEEAPKVEIATPTTEQVAAVEKSVVEEPKQ